MSQRVARAPKPGLPRTRAVQIGLIGPIGCGKTTVAGWLAGRGAAVVDADALTREVMAPGTDVAEAVIDHFGERFRTAGGALDRAALGRHVFADASALAELEAIVHPAIRERLEAAVLEADATGAPMIVLEAIKLVEAGYARTCDEVWLVTCSPERQLERLLGRGTEPRDAEQRRQAQAASAGLWRRAAKRTLRTDGSREDVERAVAVAFEEALAKPRR